MREYIIGQFKKDRRGLYASMYNRDQKEDDRLVHGRLAEAYEVSACADSAVLRDLFIETAKHALIPGNPLIFASLFLTLSFPRPLFVSHFSFLRHSNGIVATRSTSSYFLLASSDSHTSKSSKSFKSS